MDKQNKYVVRIQVIRKPITATDSEVVLDSMDVKVGHGALAERAARAVAHVVEIEASLKLSSGGN